MLPFDPSNDDGATTPSHVGFLFLMKARCRGVVTDDVVDLPLVQTLRDGALVAMAHEEEVLAIQRQQRRSPSIGLNTI
jgi:hypothetical protein